MAADFVEPSAPEHKGQAQRMFWDVPSGDLRRIAQFCSYIHSELTFSGARPQKSKRHLKE